MTAPQEEGEEKAPQLIVGSLNPDGPEPGDNLEVNLKGLGDSDEELSDEAEASKVEVEIAPEARHEVLLRQIDAHLATHS